MSADGIFLVPSANPKKHCTSVIATVMVEKGAIRTYGVLVTEGNTVTRKSLVASEAVAAMVTTVRTATIQTSVL